MGNCTMGWYLVDTLFLLSLIYSSELGKNQVLFREMKLAHAQTYCIYTYHMHHVHSYTVRCTYTHTHTQTKTKIKFYSQTQSDRHNQTDRHTTDKYTTGRQTRTCIHGKTHKLAHTNWHTGTDILGVTYIDWHQDAERCLQTDTGRQKGLGADI